MCGPKRKAPGRSSGNSPIIIIIIIIIIRLIKPHGKCMEDIKNAHEILVGET